MNWTLIAIVSFVSVVWVAQTWVIWRDLLAHGISGPRSGVRSMVMGILMPVGIAWLLWPQMREGVLFDELKWAHERSARRPPRSTP